MENLSTENMTQQYPPQKEKSNILTQAIVNNGLVVFTSPKNLDIRPLSLVLTSIFTTGGKLGGYNIPSASAILYLEGEFKIEQLEKTMAANDFPREHGRIKYLSFPSTNTIKELATEEDAFLTNDIGRNLVASEIKEKTINLLIVHTLSTVSNHFLLGSEKDVVLFLRKIQQSCIPVIVFAESGTKGLSVLESMATLVLKVTEAENAFDALIKVECTKLPAYEIERPQPFCLSLSRANESWSVTEIKDPSTTLDLIIAMACAGRTQEKIGKEVNLQQYQVSRILGRAEEDGLIIKKGRRITRA